MSTPTTTTPTYTYRHLIQPLPPKRNLLTIATLPASPPCPTCAHLLRLPALDPSNTVQDATTTTTTIPIDAYHRVDTFPHFPALRASASSGCDLCRLLRKTVRRAWGTGVCERGVTPLVEDDDAYEGLLEAAWDGQVRIHRARVRARAVGGVDEQGHEQRLGAVAQGDGDGDEEVVVVGLTVEFGPAAGEVVSDEGEVLAEEIGRVLWFKAWNSVDVESAVSASRRNLPSGETLSERNVDLIKGWIDGCKTKHGNACQVKSQWMPTRLLAVDSLRLVETADGGVQDDDRRYAALSYTRGTASSDAAIRTTLENWEERKGGMDLAELPRTFRDAVLACRALGIPFLWVDALCIMDDAEDRNREVVLMPKTFGNAEVTLAATSAISPQSGFLGRNISAIPAAKIGGEKRYMVLALQDDKHHGMRSSDIDDSPWSQDAWALVERMLSARLVHFAKNKIYFECRRALRSEENDAESTARKPSSLWAKVDEGSDKHQYRPFFYEQWRSFLVNYCAKRFDGVADKLLPVRAVAEEMGTTIDDEYLPSAGMWKGDLAAQLLWYTESDSPQAKRSAAQAPTWSWALVDAKIGFVRGTTDGEMPPALADDKFNMTEISQGPLTLTGYTREISAILSIDSGDEWLAEMRKEYPWDLLAADDEDDESVRFAQGSLSNSNAIVSAAKRLMYLHVTSEVHPTGLILAQTADSGSTWQRIGVATIFDLGDLVADPPFLPDSVARVVVV